MSRIKKMLSDRAHRPFPIPTSKWLYYQEWNDALFLHYKVPYTLLKSILPKNLKIDTFNGKAYISIVLFTMQNIRPRLLPAVGFVSDFHEINVRTYIDMDGRKGVYFLNIEAEKLLSAFVARRLSGLPYEKSYILRHEGYYQSVNKRKGFSLETSFSIGETLTNKTDLDLWLTERYCLYLTEKGNIYRYDIHHSEWEVKAVTLQDLDLNYEFGPLKLHTNLKRNMGQPDAVHYSPDVDVVAWDKEKLNHEAKTRP